MAQTKPSIEQLHAQIVALQQQLWDQEYELDDQRRSFNKKSAEQRQLIDSHNAYSKYVNNQVERIDRLNRQVMMLMRENQELLSRMAQSMIERMFSDRTKDLEIKRLSEFQRTARDDLPSWQFNQIFSTAMDRWSTQDDVRSFLIEAAAIQKRQSYRPEPPWVRH